LSVTIASFAVAKSPVRCGAHTKECVEAEAAEHVVGRIEPDIGQLLSLISDAMDRERRKIHRPQHAVDVVDIDDRRGRWVQIVDLPGRVSEWYLRATRRL